MSQLETDVKHDESETVAWIKKFEKRHVKMVLCTKLCMTATFFAIYLLPPHHAAWVSALTNFIWLWAM